MNDLAVDVVTLQAKYLKPSVIQELWTPEYSDYTAFHELSMLDWGNLPVSRLRDFSADIATLNISAWKSFLPALMMAAIKKPYLTFEYGGTLVREMVNLLAADVSNDNVTLHGALSDYSNEELAIVCRWLEWYAEQEPNFKNKSEFEVQEYRRLRGEQVLTAIENVYGF